MLSYYFEIVHDHLLENAPDLLFIVRSGVVVITLASYTVSPGFESLPGDRVSWLSLFVDFLPPPHRTQVLVYEGMSKSFRTGRLERELQMVQFSATRCSCMAILWASLVSFAALTLCVASQRGFVSVYFVIDSVRKLLDTPSYYLNADHEFFLPSDSVLPVQVPFDVITSAVDMIHCS
jgi:hypothetical protein